VRVGRPDDRDLAWGGEVKVERAERVAEGRRSPRECRPDQAKDAHGPSLELVVAEDPGETEQDVGEHRVAGGGRVVVEVLLARHQLLSVRGREVETTPLLVREQVDRHSRQSTSLLEPPQVAGRGGSSTGGSGDRP